MACELRKLAMDGLVQRYRLLYEHVHGMSMREKRSVFGAMRDDNKRHVRRVIVGEVFMPEHGIHFGEFAVFQLLNEYTRKTNNKERVKRNLSLHLGDAPASAGPEGSTPLDALVVG
jgi:hypothetical protein